MAESMDMEKILLSSLADANVRGSVRMNAIADIASQTGMTVEQTLTQSIASPADDATMMAAMRTAIHTPSKE